MYLYRAMDSAGYTPDFLLNATRKQTGSQTVLQKVTGWEAHHGTTSDQRRQEPDLDRRGASSETCETPYRGL